MSFFNRSLAIILTIALPLSLASCNTISGIGQDVSAGGHALTKSADQTQDDLDSSSSDSSGDSTKS